MMAALDVVSKYGRGWCQRNKIMKCFIFRRRQTMDAAVSSWAGWQ